MSRLEMSKPDFRVNDSSSSLVPFIYFDGAMCHGTALGIIQVELGAKAIARDETQKSGAREEVVVTARLRCSPAAAKDLKRALENALELERATHAKEQSAAVVAVKTH
jgi:hypothetical protein